MCPGLQSTARSKAEQPAKGPLLILLLVCGGLVEIALTRFACWASTSTAPYGHCTGGHLDVGRADFVSEGEEQERAQRRAPCGAII